jgi:hypothetical protein
MHPRTTELLQYIDHQTAELFSAFESVPAERRGTRPAADRWSPAEVVHHVMMVEQRVTPLLRSLIEQARAIGPEHDESSVLAILNAQRFVSRVTRFNTSAAFQPQAANAETIRNEFDEVRRALRDVILTGDGLALGDVSAPHVALGTLTGYGWIAFIGSHAARHAAQIREDCV